MSTTQILDGKTLADEINLKLRWQVVNQKLHPSLAIVLVGDDPASHLYVKLKEKACNKVGIKLHKYLLDKDTSEKEVLESIDWLNNDKDIDAILIQLPLPDHLDENKIIRKIKPSKDADGFHPSNLKNNQSVTIPAPANAIYKLIRASETFQAESKAVVIANHDIIAKPLENLLKEFYIKTEYIDPKNEKEIIKKAPQADILVVAVGKPNFIKAENIKGDAIIIDVGTNQVKGKTVGDVDIKGVYEIASAITPVPGGVGPVTIACLLENVVALHKLKNNPR